MNDKVSRMTNKFLKNTLRPRNPFGDSEIMRKGGSHMTPKRDKHSKRQIEQEMMAYA